MITNTFSHIKGIGDKAEQKLWSNNILTWDDFLSSDSIPLSKPKTEMINKELLLSKTAFQNEEPDYFSQTLKTSQHWRLFKEFKESAVYLDIETTGLLPDYSEITTCVMYDGRDIKYYVNGKNLNKFVKDLREYKTIITYNGKTFDIPFIESFFKVKLHHSHIDLRYILAGLGYSGGLKECEKKFGLSRDSLEGIDGYFAVLLWNEFKKGKKTALDTLLAYNIEDVLNLEFLMHSAYNLNINKTIFKNTHKLEIPLKPEPEFTPDLKLVKILKDKYFPYD